MAAMDEHGGDMGQCEFCGLLASTEPQHTADCDWVTAHRLATSIAPRATTSVAMAAAKAPICDHGQPPSCMVPSRKIAGTWECDRCGARRNDPDNPSVCR